ncbi:hypothetical protein DNTS_000299 [Danionella cerebrum]|uniref:UPF3 domain-containing protein n=1 Tax=Danionella cerebrum TaxID=2873325 RepID=A0A553R706_9TELE|nr:hypothetical protein DNTS_000299 [Danionella translucida]
MKEDKENTRPRETNVDIKCEEHEKSEKPSKEKKEAMTKIVIRRLPPTLTKDDLMEQLQPLPELDYLEFFSSDTSLFPHLFARAYLNFKNQEDIVLFRDRFDGYVFIDGRGQEYPAIVEFAPFQKVAKKRSKKKDAKSGTIEDDPDYKKFLDVYNGDEEKSPSNPETLLEEIEAKTKELSGKKSTPLLDFLKNKQRIREEKKEERRRRELERKRLRDEERRKWREEDRRKRKDAEKLKKGEKAFDKDKEQSRDEHPKIKKSRKTSPKKTVRSRRTNELNELGETSGSDRMENTEKKRGSNQRRAGTRNTETGMENETETGTERESEDRKKKNDSEGKMKNGGEGGNIMMEKTPIEREMRMEREKRNAFGRRGGMIIWERPWDRPAIQLYQPGARSRNRGGGGTGGDGQTSEKRGERESQKAEEKAGE